MYVDAHCHIKTKEEAEYVVASRIALIANCQSEPEYRFLKEFEGDRFKLSAGIHPWESERLSFEKFEPILDMVNIIGEIGLDNVWSECDILTQIKVFEAQLQYAAQRQKPVILHTKGMEKEVLELIRKYPNTYCVHWYSAAEYLDDFIDLDCYFTLGASYLSDPNVHRVLERVPLKRLMTETDGLVALSWAINREVSVQDWGLHLQGLNAYIAVYHQKSLIDIRRIIMQNFERFTKQKTT